jgi:hypothetical protein
LGLVFNEGTWSIASDDVWEEFCGDVSVVVSNDSAIANINVTAEPLVAGGIVRSPDQVTVLGESDWELVSVINVILESLVQVVSINIQNKSFSKCQNIVIFNIIIKNAWGKGGVVIYTRS